MTKPSQKNNAMTYSREEYERRWDEVVGGAIEIDGSDRDLEIILAALRIAASQMTEREKVVALIKERARDAARGAIWSDVNTDRRGRISVLPANESAHVQLALDALADKIERGDHSSAKPAGEGR